MTPEELAQTLERLHEQSFGWALSCCGWDRPVAEDALQTAYVRIVSGTARYEGRSSFRTWLFGVIRRVSQEQRRRQRVDHGRSVSVDAIDRAHAVNPDPMRQLVQKDASRRLRGALSKLPERQREVLHLVFYEDMTIAEAADVMGVSLGSARTHYHRGKMRMRALVQEEAIHG